MTTQRQGNDQLSIWFVAGVQNAALISKIDGENNLKRLAKFLK